MMFDQFMLPVLPFPVHFLLTDFPNDQVIFNFAISDDTSNLFKPTLRDLYNSYMDQMRPCIDHNVCVCVCMCVCCMLAACKYMCKFSSCKLCMVYYPYSLFLIFLCLYVLTCIIVMLVLYYVCFLFMHLVSAYS